MKNGSFANPPLGFETKETSLISAGTRSGMLEQHRKLRKQDFSKLTNPNKNYTVLHSLLRTTEKVTTRFAN